MSAAPPRVPGDAPVRLAQVDDRAAVVDCVSAAFGVFIPRIGKPPAPMLADYAALIARGQVHLIDDGGGVDGVIVLAAEAGGLLVDVVAVRPARQRHGLGRRLMALAEEEARARGLAEIRLYTHEVMSGALALYRALGFEETARRVEDDYARVYLRKKLRAELTGGC